MKKRRPEGRRLIQLWLACKWPTSALPVLTYFNVRSAPVLELNHFRLSLS